MKRTYILTLLLALLLLGCEIVAGAETAAAETESSQSTQAAAETAPSARSRLAEAAAKAWKAPDPARSSEPEPEPTLSATVLELSAPGPVTADAPTARLSLRVAETALTGQEGQLRLLQNGEEILSRSFRIYPGALGHYDLPVAFTRYMQESSAVFEAVLEYGGESVQAGVELALENWPDEVWAEQSGDSRPYSIDVVKNQNVVVVYGKDEAGDYSMPVKIFLCSTGRWTPSGTWSLGYKFPWRSLFGGVYGQYAIIISGNYLFHSVPYSRMAKDRLETEEYNKLGTTASMGCVRLAAADCKWIYDHCPSGTRVHMYNSDDELPLPRPELEPIDENDPRAGWDPTDPDPENPWNAVDS